MVRKRSYVPLTSQPLQLPGSVPVSSVSAIAQTEDLRTTLNVHPPAHTPTTTLPSPMVLGLSLVRGDSHYQMTAP